jgi:hypothetical protein
VCRALLVVCVAPDRDSLMDLKRAVVATDWELTPGATTADEAVAQVGDRGAHVLVAAGGVVPDVVAAARERWPWLRIVAVSHEPVEGATAVVASLDDVRAAVKGLPPPGGPVRS